MNNQGGDNQYINNVFVAEQLSRSWTDGGGSKGCENNRNSTGANGCGVTFERNIFYYDSADWVGDAMKRGDERVAPVKVKTPWMWEEDDGADSAWTWFNHSDRNLLFARGVSLKDERIFPPNRTLAEWIALNTKFDTNSLVDVDPKFENPRDGNFNLTKESEVADKIGFEPLPNVYERVPTATCGGFKSAVFDVRRGCLQRLFPLPSRRPVGEMRGDETIIA